MNKHYTISGTLEHKLHEDLCDVSLMWCVCVSGSLLYPQLSLAQCLAHSTFSICICRILMSESYHIVSKATCSAPYCLQHWVQSSELANRCPLPRLCCPSFQNASLFHFLLWLVNFYPTFQRHLKCHQSFVTGFLTCHPLTTTIIIHSLLLWSHILNRPQYSVRHAEL